MAKKTASKASKAKVAKSGAAARPDLKFKVNKVTTATKLPGGVGAAPGDIVFPPSPIYGKPKGKLGGGGIR
ncbi:MAG: hypothetical protein ACXW2D_15800 [Burkholderiaceae bacterium]